MCVVHVCVFVCVCVSACVHSVDIASKGVHRSCAPPCASKAALPSPMHTRHATLALPRLCREHPRQGAGAAAHLAPGEEHDVQLWPGGPGAPPPFVRAARERERQRKEGSTQALSSAAHVDQGKGRLSGQAEPHVLGTRALHRMSPRHSEQRLPLGVLEPRECLTRFPLLPHCMQGLPLAPIDESQAASM